MFRYACATAVLALGLAGTGSAFAQQSNVTLRVANYGGVFTAAQKKYAGDLFTRAAVSRSSTSMPTLRTISQN